MFRNHRKWLQTLSGWTCAWFLRYPILCRSNLFQFVVQEIRKMFYSLYFYFFRSFGFFMFKVLVPPRLVFVPSWWMSAGFIPEHFMLAAIFPRSSRNKFFTICIDEKCRGEKFTGNSLPWGMTGAVWMTASLINVRCSWYAASLCWQPSNVQSLFQPGVKRLCLFL